MSLTLHIIGKAGHMTNSQTYQEAVKVLVGEAASKGVSLTMGIYILGTCTSLLIVIADQIETIFKHSWLTRTVIIIGAGILIFPLMLIQDIALLSYSSTFGVLAQIYMVVCVMYHCIDGIIEDGLEFSPIEKALWGRSLGSAFALYTFALQCHLIFIPVTRNLENKTQARMDGVAITGVFTCVFLYTVVGALGYLKYGAHVNPDILAYNLPNTIDVKIARLAIALKSVVAYPLLHFAARLCVADLVGFDLSLWKWQDSRYPKKFFITITVIFLCISIYIATKVSGIDKMIDLNGALLGVFQVYFWPALMFYFYHKPPRPRVNKVISLILILICFGVTGFATYDSLTITRKS